MVAGERFCRSCGAPAAVETSDADVQAAAAATSAGGEEPGSDRQSDAIAADEPAASDKKPEAQPKRETSQPAQESTSPASSGQSTGPPWVRIAAVGGVIVALGVVAAVAIGLGGGGGGSSNEGEDPYKSLTEIEKASAEDEESDKTDANPDNGKLPAQTRREMTRSVREVIRKHHQYVAEGNYAAAFDLMSRRKQEQPLYDTPSCQDSGCWGATMGPLTSGLTQPVRPSVSIVRTFKSDGVAEIKVRLPMPSCPTGAWEGITWARYEKNRWTYDPGWKTNETQRSRYDGPGDSQDPRLLGVSCET